MTILDTLAACARARTEQNKRRISPEKMKELALSMDADTGYPFERRSLRREFPLSAKSRRRRPRRG